MMQTTTESETAERDHYQITRRGAAWSTVRYGTLADEVARVEQILDLERQRASGVNRWDGWIECAYEFGVSPVEIQIERWDYATRKSTVVARWVRGVREDIVASSGSHESTNHL